MHRRSILTFSAITALGLALLPSSTNAVADSPNLKGDYGFTRTEECIVSRDPNFPAFPGRPASERKSCRGSASR
jgi:hypothetical protein